LFIIAYTQMSTVGVNSSWLEALDPGSGRLYYVDLTTHQTAWEAPPTFSDRKQLAVAQHILAAEIAVAESQAAEGGAGGLDEAAFLARIRQRFPPPTTPPPSTAVMQQRISSLESENADLRRQLQGQGSAADPAPLPPRLMSRCSSVASSRPSWVRGASAVLEAPPPPPQWAIQLSRSSCGSSAT